MKRALLCSLALLLVPALGRAQVAKVLTPAEAQAAFRVANDACLKDDLQACIEGYEKLLEAGYAGADLEFNLGTAFLKQGRAGPAVLHLERALRLDPSDPDARANLDRAQRLRVDKLVGTPEETGGEEPLASRVVSHTHGDRWALAFLLLWTLGGLALLGQRLLATAGRRALALVGGLLLVTASVPCGVVTAFHSYVRECAHDAVVVAPSLPVREGPRDTYKSTFEVHEGLKVRVLDQEGGFCRIRLSNGLQGWVPASGVTEITQS
ncbi:MAG TPA: SH3 domain-containing protein [Myxococcales bacterium]